MSPVLAPAFPTRVIAIGSPDKQSVLAIQQRLNVLKCGPVNEDGRFGPETLEAVELFQMRFSDSSGNPLVIDGQVGPMTWASLFGTKPSVITQASSTLSTAVLSEAQSQVGVMESPLNSNSGPKVDEYLASVDSAPGNPWCAAFVYWCFRQAASTLSVPNPAIRTASALDVWNHAGARGLCRIGCKEASDSPGLVQPGMIFVLSTGGVHGHVGLVQQISGVVLTTIEGNTNSDGSSNGIGVFQRKARRISQINRGFVDCTRTC